MKLLVFAHRGEAQTFLKYGQFQAKSFAFEGLFTDTRDLLLICGEGLESASLKTAATLAAHPEITQVINFGVAGALNSKLALNDLVEIRTVYREQDGKIQFHSFTANGGVDLISSNQRVLDSAYARHLENFAPLVDREAWGIASAATLFKIPFRAIKLVSDRVGEQTEICRVVKDKAGQFSDCLYEAYPRNSLAKVNEKTIELEGFHMSVSQKRQLAAVLHKLGLKGKSLIEIWDEVKKDDIANLDLLPKKRTQELLKALTELLNPVHKKITCKLDELSAPFDKANVKIKFDKDLEDSTVHLSAVISSPKHINDLIASLESFRYDKVREIFDGKWDV